MKEISGIVEFRGDGIQVNEGNNEVSVIIEKISPYDFQSVIMSQNDNWKLDLINDLCHDLGINEVAKNIKGLFSKIDMEECWIESAKYADEVIRISNGLSNLSTPTSNNKEEFFKRRV